MLPFGVCAVCDGDFELRHPQHQYCSQPCMSRAGTIRNHGLTVQQFRQMESAQMSACGICGRDDVPLCIDHNHTTGVVRGLLCTCCNAGLGMFQEDVQALHYAIAYLQRHNT